MKTLWTEVMEGGEVRFRLCVYKNGRDHQFTIHYKDRADGKWKLFHKYKFPIEYFTSQFSDINSRLDVAWLSLEFLVKHIGMTTNKHAIAHVHHVMAVLYSYLASMFYKKYEDELLAIKSDSELQ